MNVKCIRKNICDKYAVGSRSMFFIELLSMLLQNNAGNLSLKSKNISGILSNRSRNQTLTKEIKRILRMEHKQRHMNSESNLYSKYQKGSSLSYFPDSSCTPGALNKTFQKIQNVIKMCRLEYKRIQAC